MKHRRRALTPVLAILLVTGVASAEDDAQAERRYLSFRDFENAVGILAEVPDAQVCGLTRAGHKLWQRDQLRLPDPTLRGDFDGDGDEDMALLLQSGDAGRCAWVGVVTPGSPTWRRRLLLRLEDLRAEASPTLLWLEHRRAIAIDLGDRERVTAPATLRWEDGRVVSTQFGYVREARLLYRFIEWVPGPGQFRYRRQEAPEVIELR